MHQRLLPNWGLLSEIAAILSLVLILGCVDEPTIPVPPPMTSSVRFIHAIPDAGAVDVWVDDKKVVTNLAYKGATQYFPDILSGTRLIRVVPAGLDTSLFYFRQLFSIRSVTKMTAVINGWTHTKYDDPKTFPNRDTNTVAILITQERFTYSVGEIAKLVDTLDKAAGTYKYYADVKLVNVLAYRFLPNVEKPDTTQLRETNAVTVIEQADPLPTSNYAGALSPYTRLETDKQSGTSYDFTVQKFINRQTGGKVATFTETLKAQVRYTFVMMGPTNAVEVVAYQDDPQ